MREHTSESQREWHLATVLRVHPDTWEVDVRLLYSSSSIVRRAKINGVFLPEIHTDARPSHVLVGWMDAYTQSPVAVPLHNTIVPVGDRKDHVFWSEHHGFRIKIREPGHKGVLRPSDQVGELEIRSLKGGRLLQLRVQEDGGIIRLDTPTTRIVQNDDENLVQIHADGDVEVDAGENIKATAGTNIEATAGGNIEAQAGADITAQAVGNIDVTAGGNLSLTATGTITIAGTAGVVITGATIALN